MGKLVELPGWLCLGKDPYTSQARTKRNTCTCSSWQHLTQVRRPLPYCVPFFSWGFLCTLRSTEVTTSINLFPKGVSDYVIQIKTTTCIKGFGYGFLCVLLKEKHNTNPVMPRTMSLGSSYRQRCARTQEITYIPLITSGSKEGLHEKGRSMYLPHSAS